MRYVNRSDITKATFRQKTYLRENFLKKPNSWDSNKKFVFLSHSHKDKDIILPVVALLREKEITVYVDWMDDKMPSITNRKTAERIKSKIRDCIFFIVLLTENSKDSKWVPWELGYADGPKDVNDIAILPIKNDRSPESVFDGVEYMKLYNTIKLDDLFDTNKRPLKIINGRGMVVERAKIFS